MKISREEKDQLKAFEKKLGVAFRKKDLLRRALTHKSYANEQQLSPLENNERLEYLGDAVLELVISDLLMKTYPEHSEGELSKLRAAVVNEHQLTEVARAIDLGKYLYLGRGEDRTGGREKPSLLSDALEAVLGAVYLDRGFRAIFKRVEKHFEKIVKRVGAEGFAKDYKTRLQEMAQARFRLTPQYKLMKATGPDHSKTFEIHLFIREKLYGTGKGHSKKSAEQKAASKALEALLEEKT